MNETLTTLREVIRRRRRSWLTPLGVVALAGTVAGVMAVPWIGGRIIDSMVEPGADGSALVRWSLLLGLAAVVSAGSRVAYRIIFAWWSAASVRTLRESALDHLQHCQVGVFDRHRTGLLSSLLSNDARLVGKIYYPIGSDLLRSIFQLAAILVIVSTQFSAIGWTLLPLIPIYLAFPLLFSRRIREISRSLQEARAESLSGIQETLEGVREIKALNRESWSSGRLAELFQRVVRQRVRTERIRSVFQVEFAIYWILLGFMYWWGGQRVMAGEMTVGKLVAFLGYVGYVRGPISRLVSINTSLQESLAAARRVLGIFDEPLEDTRGAAALPTGDQASTIRFEGVTFRYDPGGDPALADVTFQVAPGTVVGLVGPSGAGKSTLIKLLLRFYLPDEGRILLGGRDLRRYDLRSLRKRFGVVFQDPFLFSGTIRQNIALGRVDASDSDVREAARIANALEFIEELPRGLDTEVGEKGNRLSGGQKQRVAIARVVLADPRILILDEATSALDTQSERLVKEALRRLMAGRTSFAIAHRLSTIRDADQLLLLDGGRLIAEGSHEELLVRSSLYEELYSFQGREGPEDLEEALSPEA